MKPKNLLLLAAGATAAHGTASASAGATKSKPNILFILVDDLGWGDLSCQYAADLRTPNIDAIFETGVRCDNFYANSNVSSPSRAALMTGRFPAMVGVPGVIRTQPRQSWGYLSPSAVTMPQMLKRAGYQTALVGKWHLGLESPNLPNERGFDHFQGFLGDMMDDYNTHRREGHNYMFLNDREIDPEGHATDLFATWGAEYITRQAANDAPFFLYLAFNAPHTPLQPPAEWLERVTERDPSLPEKRAKLVALIEHMDYNVGRVMEALRKSGQFENTLVVFASDNGGDRGAMANNGPARGAKGDMFEGGLRVPCAVRLPGVCEGGRRNDDFIMLMDFLPTFCDMLNIPVGHPIDGISVLASLKGEEQDTADRYRFWLRNEGGPNFCGKTQSAARYRNHKFLQNMPFEQAQLFDLVSDSLEASPLELKGPAYRDLHRALTDHYRKWGAVPCQPPVQTDKR